MNRRSMKEPKNHAEFSLIGSRERIILLAAVLLRSLATVGRCNSALIMPLNYYLSAGPTRVRDSSINKATWVVNRVTSDIRNAWITDYDDARRFLSPRRVRARIVACAADAKVSCNVARSNLRFFCDAFLKNEAARLLHLSSKPKTECAAERTRTSESVTRARCYLPALQSAVGDLRYHCRYKALRFMGLCIVNYDAVRHCEKMRKQWNGRNCLSYRSSDSTGCIAVYTLTRTDSC